MADITRDSLNLPARYEKLVFQRNRNVLDMELNEMQDIARINRYYSDRFFGTQATFQDHVIAKSVDSLRVEGENGTDDEVLIRAGEAIVWGYLIKVDSDFTLTLPSSSGDEYSIVYMSITEATYTAIDDSGIAVSSLGETAQRRKLVVTFAAANQDTLPADSGAEPWAGTSGTRHAILAFVYRDATPNPIFDHYVLDKRVFSPQIQAAIDRNTLVTIDAGGGISWDLATDTLTVRGVRIKHPFGNLNGSAGADEWLSGDGVGPTFEAVLADGEALGFRRVTGDPNSGFRRHHLQADIGGVITWGIPDDPATTDPTYAKAEIFDYDHSSDIDDDLWIFAVRITDAIYLRSGVVLQDGEQCVAWTESPTLTSSSSSFPLRRFKSAFGSLGAQFDSFGLLAMSIARMDEIWDGAFEFDDIATSSATGAAGARWWYQDNDGDFPDRIAFTLGASLGAAGIGKYISMRPQPASTAGAFQLIQKNIDGSGFLKFSTDGDWIFALEFNIRVSVQLSTSNGDAFWIGLRQDSTTSFNDLGLIGFRKDNSSARWQAVAGPNGGSITTTPIGPTTVLANEIVEFKLVVECQGGATQATFLCNGGADGIVTYDSLDGIPDDEQLDLFAAVEYTGGGTSEFWAVSPIRVQFRVSNELFS